MKLSNIAVIFIIIVIPIILLLSNYISLQIDTLNMKTAYNSNQLRATREAIEAFEINTVEWNSEYSTVADSKRRDIMASINTFTTSFANGIGIGGTSKENILTYIPAIACTLYDGYYIYSPAETKEVIKDEDGLVVYMTQDLADELGYTSYNDETDKGKILYKCESSDFEYNDEPFTLNSDDAISTYQHILKPYATYSARYKKGDIDITVNYTLDNYITIYGTVIEEGQKKYVKKSGYLINDNFSPPIEYSLIEKVAWRWNEDEDYTCEEYSYIYAEDNTKVYFDINTSTQFIISSTGVRTNLGEGTTKVKYKKLNQEGQLYYQALNSYDIDENGELDEETDIIAGKWYTKKDDATALESDQLPYLLGDVSAINYYTESIKFTDWVKNVLGDITIGDMQGVENASLYGNEESQVFKFEEDNNNPESEDSIFANHKREVIKQCLISNLRQAITSYSGRSPGEYQLPVLKETDWDQILRNVSIVTFVQNIPIGMKYYNNYTVATSTNNKEYVNPDGIYLSDLLGSDGYYHIPYCEKLDSESVIGYRCIDYVVKSYKNENETNYYYKHSDIADQQCYYCLVQRNLYEAEETLDKTIAYKTALSRERYVSHEFLNKEYDI